jgi:preprotein translocase subunit SecD
VVEQRLDFDGWPRGDVIGVVSEKDGFRLSVGVYGDDPKLLAQIEERLTYQGRLEFRLLADRDFDAHIAAAASDEQNDVRIDNRIVGWWIPAAVPQRESLEETLRETVVTRTSRGGEFEVLVLNGAHDISGEHVVDAARGWDMNRFPMLSLQFNSFGAQQMSALSRAAIERAEGPRTDAGEREDFGAGATHLGVIFDGRLVSAPRITGELGGYVQVAGDFTESQIDTFVSVLRGGELPARLVLRERRKP